MKLTPIYAFIFNYFYQDKSIKMLNFSLNFIFLLE